MCIRDRGNHEYGSARNYVTFCGTYIFSFDKDDLRRDMTCAPYKYDKDLNQEYDMGIAGMEMCIRDSW